MTTCRSKDRKDTNGHVKQAFDAKEQIREYFQPVIEDMDPQEGIEEPYKVTKRAFYCQHPLRVKHPHVALLLPLSFKAYTMHSCKLA